MRGWVVLASACLAAPPGGTALAAGPSFKVIAKLSGAPAIGAIDGGSLYGTVAAGGSHGAGLLFSLTQSGHYTDLHDFVSARDGSAPNSPLAAGTHGDIWGTAQSGGANGGGTLFLWTASGFSVPHAFGAGQDGSLPLQGPVFSPLGDLVGTTAGGAVGTNGNLWLYQKPTYRVLHDFMSGPDGHCPFSGPTIAAPGVVYGTTIGRGFGGNPTGSIWRYTSGKVTTVYVFKNGDDGEWPDQAPVTDKAGNVYGTTHIQNGASFAGAVWKVSAGGVFSVLHDLRGYPGGYAPNSPLILNTDGYLYGTTSSGGTHHAGIVFRVSTTGTFEIAHSFTGGSDGANPTGSLVHDENGTLYGGTASGTVFEIKYPAASAR